MAKHEICHIELNTTNLARAQAFYEDLFGWTFRSFGDSMVVFGVGDKHLGGLMLVDDVQPGASPSIWIEVEDVDASCAQAAALGGGLRSEKGPVPGVGFSAQIHDLDGNTVGLVQFVAGA